MGRRAAGRRTLLTSKPESWLAWIVVTALCLLVAVPLLMLLLHLIMPQFYLGDYSLGDFGTIQDLWEREAWRRAISNSLWLSLGTMVLGTGLGAGLAYLRSRYRFPLASTIDFSAWFILVMPSFIIAQGWVLFARGSGIAQQMGMPWVTDLIYSLPGLIIVMSLTNFPYAYLAVSAALQWDVRSYENAARLCGASAGRVLWSIRFRLLRPALISAAILVFVDTIGDYGLPAAFRSTFRFDTITYQIRTEVQTVPVSFEGGAVLSAVLVAIVATAITIQYRILRGSGYDFLTGSAGFQQRPTPAHWPLWTSLTGLFLVLAVVFPLGTSLSVSFFEQYSAGFSLENFTLAHYQEVLQGGSIMLAAIQNSFGIAAAAAAIAVVVGFLAAYLLSFTRHGMRTFIDISSTVTLAVPGIVLAVGYILLWNQQWLYELGIEIYNTPVVLVLCSAAASIPIAVRVILGAVAQTPSSFMASAALQGAGFFTRIRTILLPLVLAGLLSAALAVFASSVFELSITTMLQPPNYPTIPVHIDEQFRTLEYGYATAGTVLTCLLTGAVIILARWSVTKLFGHYLNATKG